VILGTAMEELSMILLTVPVLPDGDRVRATRAAHAGSPWSWAIAFTKR